MVEYKIPSDLTLPIMANVVHLKDSLFYASGDESIFPASTAYSECDSSSDMTSVLLTARSTNSTNLLEENAADISVNDTTARQIDLKEDLSTNCPLIPGNCSKRVSPQLTNFFSEQSSTAFMPIPAESANSVTSPRSTPSPGISKMLRSLSDHPSERPCTPNASTLYKNTLTHCNPSELGQLTYDECMFFTQWANSFLQHSQDKFLITDIARDLGDGITLLSLVEMLVGEYPPQIHIKPALDVQKMENVQTCLNFLEYYNVSVNDITAEDIVKGNLKVVLALCHCLYRHFGSTSQENHQVHPVKEEGHLAALFGWVSRMTGKQVTDFQSFQDGTVLCLLINTLFEDAVPNLVLQFGSPFEKVSLVLQVSSEKLGIVSNVRTEDITQLRNRERFHDYLESLYLLHSNRTKGVLNTSDQTNLKREIKRLQLREQRLKERQGSGLTYLGELSQNKSSFATEKRERSQEIPTVDINRTKQLDELGVVSPTGSNPSKMWHNQSLTVNTKRELDELEEELRLLKLECSDNSYDTRRYWTEQPGQISFNGTFSLGLPTPNLPRHQRQTNVRQELKNLHRGNPVIAQLDKRGQKTVGNTHSNVDTSSMRDVLNSDRENGKLPFGGCYLSEPSNGLENSERWNLDLSFDGSCVFTDYPIRPSFPLQRSSPPLVNSKKVKRNGHALIPEPRLETKEISNLFDLDFSDFDARISRSGEDSAIKRMVRAGNRSKLNSNANYGLDAGLSSGSALANPKDKVAKSSMEIPLTLDKRERFDASGRKLRHGLDGKLSDISNGDDKMPKQPHFVSSISQRDQRESSCLRGVQSQREFAGIKLSSTMAETKENHQVTRGLSRSFAAGNDKEDLIPTSLRSLPSGRSTTFNNEERSLSKETPFGKISRQSREPVKQLQESVSEEKRRHRQQVLATKTSRKNQPSSTKTHLHALTALIRSSSRNAGAACSEED